MKSEGLLNLGIVGIVILLSGMELFDAFPSEKRIFIFS